MTAIVNTGDNNGVCAPGKKSRVKAHRDRVRDKKECKLQSATARLRSEQASYQAALADFGDDPTAYCTGNNTCPCTGVQPVLNGLVREGNIVLHYSEGKLLAAHCG